jgi:hypothetical protein
MSQRELMTLIALLLLAVAIGTVSAWYFERRKRTVSITIAGLALCPLVLAIALFFILKHTQHPLRYEGNITAGESEYAFALYRDDRIGEDASWHVFKIPKNVNVKKYRIPADYINPITEQSKKWRQQRVLYISAKGEEDIGEARLYIVHGKYLVLIRNGMFQGLYDIRAERTILDDQSRIFAADVISDKEAADFIDDLFALLKYPKLNEDEMEELIAGIQRSHVNQSILDIIEKDKQDPNSQPALR